MKSYSLSHLADRTLLRDLATLVARDRDTTACLLAHLAEVDARKLYLPAAYPSMLLYCIHELHLSEDSACKRIRVARTARQFPALFTAVAEGRLHLSGVVLLAPHLRVENADVLLAAAAYKSKAEIEKLLAERFPNPEVLALVEALPASPVSPGAAPAAERPGTAGGSMAPEPAALSAPGRIGAIDVRAKLAPVGPRRFALHLTMSEELHDKLCYAQELLSHQVTTGDVAAVLERALDVLIPRLERGKFAATAKPRPASRRPTSARHVPAHVKRAVWERDGGRCTFVSGTGHRCPARSWLEFDHIEEVARGGRATISGMRLRCRAHNQHGAERTFGVEFMRHKREAARRSTTVRAGAAAAAPQESTTSPEQTAVRARAEEVIPWLRALGFRADEARRAAAVCETTPEASLEQRVRTALRHLAPRASALGRASAVWAGHAP